MAAPESMNFSYRVGWTTFRLLFRTYFRWRIYHPERVPLTGPVILASNHASFLDPPLVGTPLQRPLSFLARDTLFRYPGIKQLLHSWQAVPVDREGGGASGIKVILAALAKGRAVVLFPEGTRTRDGALQKARAGLGLVVAKSNAPVVPVRLFGTFEAFGRHRIWPRPHRVTVVYGNLMRFDAEIAAAAQATKDKAKKIYLDISSQIMEAVAALKPG